MSDVYVFGCQTDNKCYYCDIETSNIVLFPMYYRPRMKDIVKGLDTPNEKPAEFEVMICNKCVDLLKASNLYNNIHLVGWDWWDAADGLPKLY